jgi:hypothetical protein
LALADVRTNRGEGGAFVRRGDADQAACRLVGQWGCTEAVEALFVGARKIF